MDNEIAFEMATSSVRFGVGVTREVGPDLADLGVKRVLVVTDPVVNALPPGQVVRESLEASGVTFAVYDRVRVEPTDESFLDAIAFARQGSYDAIVAVGGGSTIDTAKAVNLYTTYPPGRFSGLREPADRQGPARPRPAQAAHRDSDDGRHGERDDRRHDLRLQEDARQDRHREPPAEADARLARSGEHAHDAGAGGGVDRPRHPEPRGRIVHRDAVHRSAAARSAAAAAGVSGVESDQRHLVARRRCGWCTQYLVRAVERPVRRRGARARCCWPRRTRASVSATRACTCRTACRIRCRATCSSYVAPGYVGRPSAGAARLLGDPERAGRVPLHGVRQPRAASAGRRGARRGRVALQGRRRRPDPRRSHHVVHAAAEDAQRPEGDRLLVVRHSRRWSRARCRSTA